MHGPQRHLLSADDLRQELASAIIALVLPVHAGVDDYGLVDVNNGSAAAIATLAGMTGELARRTVDARTRVAGFSSVEDLGMLLNLPSDTVDQMRDVAIFILA